MQLIRPTRRKGMPTDPTLCTLWKRLWLVGLLESSVSVHTSLCNPHWLSVLPQDFWLSRWLWVCCCCEVRTSGCERLPIHDSFEQTTLGPQLCNAMREGWNRGENLPLPDPVSQGHEIPAKSMFNLLTQGIAVYMVLTLYAQRATAYLESSDREKNQHFPT